MSVKTVKAVINGTTHTLTYSSSSGKYEATITAPNQSSYPETNHYFNVQLTAEDDAGNETTIDSTDPTLGENLKLYVKEKTPPVITITSPTEGATITNNTPKITWSVTDNDSGVDPSTITIKIDAAVATSTGITNTPSDNGFSCSYTPTTLADGEHTITINASDYDGNAATAKTVTFKVDTVPPTLSVTAPINNLITNTAALTITGTTNDVTSSPVTVKITLNSTDQGAVTVESSGAFSKAVTLASGVNTIVITATDSAGKSSSVTRTVTLDTGAPVFNSVTITPNPVDAGQTYVISVDVTD
jgi:hypothetical protein